MYWYQYMALACMGICIIACFWHFFRLIRLGKPKDLSQKSGNLAKAEIYSYTTAMLPNKKESAYLHIPTFTAGMLFHIGTFVSLLLFVLFLFVDLDFFREYLPLAVLLLLLLVGLVVSSLCGFGLLLKRIFSNKLRALSSLDDYLSSFLTILFQVFTGFYLVFGDFAAIPYYISASILLLYLPVGKLRHAVYFFAARYQLGWFYGWRNSWPPSSSSETKQ